MNPIWNSLIHSNPTPPSPRVPLCLYRVENRLYNLSEEEVGLYPAYLVLLTSVAGFLAARRLEAANQMGPWATWLGSCLYFAKLPMLVVNSPNVMWASALVMLAATPPLLLYK